MFARNDFGKKESRLLNGSLSKIGSGAVRCMIEKTEWGWMGIAVQEGAVAAVVLPCISSEDVEASLAREIPDASHHTEADPAVKELFSLLASYLRGYVRELSIPYIVPTWATTFQRTVWEIVRGIPYGQTKSYGWVAAEAGSPRGARAVGQALRRNPVPLIVPCHRVVASDGSMGGFTGGIEIKRRLLALEKRDVEILR